MEKRRLRNIEVSPIGHGYGEITTEEYSIEAIRKAYEFGCTFFDTAEAYGPNMLPENKGHNEKIVGKAVKDFRKDIVIVTKFHLETAEAKSKGVEATMREHLERSLRNLQTDYADVYYPRLMLM